MASVTYNGQCFAIDGRRIWIVGASMQYARMPQQVWADRIAAARQAGFNTIETACPWFIHEPRRGRFDFEGDSDLAKFIKLCGHAGMRVILRLGPHVGEGFDGGGIPGWLIETPGVRLREYNEIFLEAVSRFFRRLISEIADLQAVSGGPILLVQVEHAWNCSNDEQAERYLHELTRYVREGGITVPIINANDLWQEAPGTIDTWRGYEDLLVNLRQLRAVQPTAPRLVSGFDAATVQVWGADRAKPGAARSVARASKGAREREGFVSAPSHLFTSIGIDKPASSVLRRLAEILAAGAQPVVAPFFAGTNFGFLGGRVAGCPDGFITTTQAPNAALAEDGSRGPTYNAIKRLMMFANHFGQVFAELDPDDQPVALDPEELLHSEKVDRGRSKAGPTRSRMSVVSLRGPQGRIVFAFGDEPGAAGAIVLDDGIRLPVQLGDQSVGWYAMNFDLHGLGRLDLANISPWAIVDRSIVVFHGPAESHAYLSIDGTPLEATVPGDGAKPVIIEHRGLTIVICSEKQIDVTYHDDAGVYVGIGGFDANGAPLPRAGAPGAGSSGVAGGGGGSGGASGGAAAWVIRKNAKIESLTFAGAGSDTRGSGKRAGAKSRAAGGGALDLEPWRIAPLGDYINGQSPRFASLDGPEPLSACGAPVGYGWYRVALSGSGRKLCAAPHSGDRLRLFVNGEAHGLIGVGPGIAEDAVAFALKYAKGDIVVALVDNFGRFCEGNDLNQSKGLFGHVYGVKPLRSVKGRAVEADPVSPFALRGFIAGRAEGQVSDSRQAAWKFSHTKKSPILVAVTGATASGTFVLNDEPVAYYAGATGGCRDQILLQPDKTESFKRGKNVLRFAPDARQGASAVEEISKATMLYECVEVLTENSWAFAKWEPPAAGAFEPFDRAQHRPLKGLPCWWRTMFEFSSSSGRHVELPVWLDVAALSKGQAFINGRNLGRYFTATGQGKPVGPQTRLYVPTSWLKPGDDNELMIFDEHGFEPSRVRIVHG